MMSSSNEEKSLQEVLGPIMRVLRDLDGQLTFRDADGVEFMLMGREYLEELRGKRSGRESQLSFEGISEQGIDDEESVDASVDIEGEPVVIRENPVEEVGDGQGEVAVEDLSEEATYDDLALIDEAEYPEAELVDGPEVESEAPGEALEEEMVFTSNRGRPSPPPVRVRFEPFGGELPPQLQE